MGGGKADVCLRIAHADYSAPSGNGTRGCGIGAFKWLGGAFHFSRGGGERLRTMPPTNSALDGSVGASLVAAAFQLRAMPHAYSSVLGIFGAPLVAAAVAFPLHTMPHTNSALSGMQPVFIRPRE